jgi:hypothetical protein
MKLMKLSCGKHYGQDPNKPCSKCAYFAELKADPNYNRTHQRNGVPWIAVLGPEIKKPSWW